MIYTVLKGGLGNQLFQFGAALRLAKGNINLIRFAFNDDRMSSHRLAELYDTELLPKLIADEEILKLQKDASSLIFINDAAHGEFNDCPLLDKELVNGKDYLIDGYFQSGRNLLALKEYCQKGNTKIKNQESFRSKSPSRIIAHYRLGDYARPDVQANIGLLNVGYLDSVISTYMTQEKTIDIYTDDPFFKERYPHLSNLNILVGGNDIEVFHAFLNAETLVTANSTFSLCAGLLSEVNQTVYRPALWTRNILSDDLCLGFEDKDIRLVPNSFY
jgi:hypothetical protein